MLLGLEGIHLGTIITLHESRLSFMSMLIKVTDEEEFIFFGKHLTIIIMEGRNLLLLGKILDTTAMEIVHCVEQLQSLVWLLTLILPPGITVKLIAMVLAQVTLVPS